MLTKKKTYLILILFFLVVVSIAVFVKKIISVSGFANNYLGNMDTANGSQDSGLSDTSDDGDTTDNETKESSSDNKDSPATKELEEKLANSLTPDQKKRAEMLISLFENGTTTIRYDYIENLDDGRGYTAGKVGFTTADGDLYEVVKAYTEIDPNNPLSGYLNTLKKLANQGSDSTSELKGFKEAWKKAAHDSKFVEVQDKVSDKIYYIEAMKLADKNGIELALSKAFFYDTIIQHGGGKDEDSLPAIVSRTNKAMGSSPKDDGISEKAWLAKMIEVRRADLKDPYNDDTKDVWQDSVGRCDVFKKLLDDGNTDLTGPIKVKTKDYDKTIP